MDRKIFIFLISIPFFLGCSVRSQEKQKVQIDSEVSNSINSFSEKMFHQMYVKGENLSFSGTSIYNLLYLISNACDGETADQINNLLEQNEKKDDVLIQQYFSNLENNYNSIWVQNNLPVKESYSDFLANIKSSLFSVDFSKGAKTTNQINKYIKEVTENEIPKFLKNDLPSDTKLCFLNALYFNQKWRHPFKKNETTAEDFYVTKDKTVSVQMMHNSELYKYTENEEFQMIQLMYADTDYSMICILPVEKDYDFSKLELNNLLSSFTKDSDYETVEVSLPKFNTDISTDLKKQFQNLGVTDIFESSSDFSNIFDTNETVFIDEILHETKVSVDEEKTKAVAVTMSFAKSASFSGIPNFYFTADHPFCYVIMDVTVKKSPLAQIFPRSNLDIPGQEL